MTVAIPLLNGVPPESEYLRCVLPMLCPLCALHCIRCVCLIRRLSCPLWQTLFHGLFMHCVAAAIHVLRRASLARSGLRCRLYITGSAAHA